MDKHTVYLNISKLYLIKALRWFMVMMPVIVLFFLDNGLSMSQVIFLQVVFSIIIVGFEVPSGYFADIVGRKASITIACILSFIGFLIYSFSYDFLGFLIAEIALGVGSSFISGADSALIYDSLIELKQEQNYKKIEGRLLLVGNFSEGIASILGGFLALISLRTPIYFEAAITFFSIPIAFSLVEPVRQKYKIAESRVKEIAKIVKYSLHDHKEIKWLIIYSGLLSASGLTMVWFIQPYLKVSGLPLVWFGIFWAVLQFSAGIFSLVAYRFEAFFGRRKSLVPLIFIIAVAYFLVSIYQTLWAIIFLFLFYFVRGVSGPILKDYVNRLISSDFRATVLSVKQLVGRIIFSIISPFIGWTSDVYSLSTALMLAGISFLLLGIIPLIYLRRHRAL